MKLKLNQPLQKIVRVSGVSFNAAEVVSQSKDQFVASHADRVFLDIPSQDERIKLLKEAYTLCSKEVNPKDNGNDKGNGTEVEKPEPAEGGKSDNGANSGRNPKSKP